MRILFGIIVLFFTLQISCGPVEKDASFLSTDGYGYAQLMELSRQTEIKNLMPNVSDFRIQASINSNRTMWYDSDSIIPGYQDSMSDPEGMRPNSIEPILIDLAVPGGHARLFEFRGRFNFPFATGGADKSTNLVKVNFWKPPTVDGSVLPVVYWTLPFSRVRWMFPVGTLLGEVLLVKYPSGDERVFEVRVRERMHTGWSNKVFRPFLQATNLADAIKELRPQWAFSIRLRSIIDKLNDPTSLTPETLRNTRFSEAMSDISGFKDMIPGFADESTAKELLASRFFALANHTDWKKNGADRTFASSTSGLSGIVPINYDGGLLEITDDSCKRCHDQAGRQIGDFYSDLVAYGELWGEDETFSWHPFDTASFVNPDGSVNNFNNDNRKIRQDFLQNGLVERYQPSKHTPSYYKELPREWVYRPI